MDTPIQSMIPYPHQSDFWITGTTNGIIYIWDRRKPNYPINKAQIHESNGKLTQDYFSWKSLLFFSVWELECHKASSNYLFSCSEDGTLYCTNYSASKELFLAELTNLNRIELIKTDAISVNAFAVNYSMDVLLAVLQDGRLSAHYCRASRFNDIQKL